MTCGASASEVADGAGLGFAGGAGLGVGAGLAAALGAGLAAVLGAGLAAVLGTGLAAALGAGLAAALGTGPAVVLGVGLGELAPVDDESGRRSGVSCGGGVGRALGAAPLMSTRSLALPLSVAKPRSPSGAPMPHDT
jgi:hypothetical protein